jgi:hypothetical protein
MLALSGSKGKVVVWNLEDNATIRSHFPTGDVIMFDLVYAPRRSA